MKKILSFLLALVLLLMPGAPALADAPGDTTDIYIQANYMALSDNSAAIEAGREGIVYSFSISWKQNGSVTYFAGQTTYKWNQNTLQYDSTNADSGWSISKDAAVVITVTNRSNIGIHSSFSNPVGKNGVTNIYGSFDKTRLDIASAATGGFTAKGSEQSDSVTYAITGVDGVITSAGVIGQITVTITSG